MQTPHKSILIFGTSHFAYRLKKKLLLDKISVVHCTIEYLKTYTDSGSLFENVEDYLASISTENIKMIFVLDDKDETNLQLIIALAAFSKNIPITASLFNEKLIPHLTKSNADLHILNRAKVAAPKFVHAIDVPLQRQPITTIEPHPLANKPPKKDKLIYQLSIAFVIVLLFCMWYFYTFEHFSLINAVYFVVTTASTVGYGDLNLLAASDTSKIVGIFLMLSTTIFVWLIFSLTIDYFLKQRIELALGRIKYKTKNHIIVCGLGKVGYFIVEQLLANGEKVIIIEIDEDSKHVNYFRSLGAEFYIGDARQSKVMKDVNVIDAKALISVIDNDALNLEIGLNARYIHPNLRLVLRIFDEEMTKHIKTLLNIELAFSASTIALDKIYEILEEVE
jgi:TrkA-N domain/Ion channel